MLDLIKYLQEQQFSLQKEQIKNQENGRITDWN